MSFYRLFGAAEVAGVCLVLVVALLFQFVLHELPCPLCLLQRLGFFGVAFAMLLNLRFGPRPSHYGFSLLFALFTSFVALRQIALHVVPGTGSFGSAVFGLHMYTWSFILAMLIVLFNAIMLSFDRQYASIFNKTKFHKYVVNALFLIVFALAILNTVTTVMECGLGQCPDNPTELIK